MLSADTQTRVSEFCRFATRAQDVAMQVTDTLSDRRTRAAEEAKYVFHRTVIKEARKLARGCAETDRVSWTVVSMRPVLPAESYRWLFDEVPTKFPYMQRKNHATNFFVVFLCPQRGDHMSFTNLATVYAHVSAATDVVFPVKAMVTAEDISRVVTRLTQQCSCSQFPWPVLPLCPLPPELGVLPEYLEARMDWFKDVFFLQHSAILEIVAILLSLTLFYIEVTPRFSHVFALVVTRMSESHTPSDVFTLKPLHEVVPPAVSMLFGLAISEAFSDINSPDGLTWSSSDCAWVRYSEDDPNSSAYTICETESAFPSSHRAAYVDFLINHYIQKTNPIRSPHDVARRIAGVALRLESLSKVQHELVSPLPDSTLKQCPVCLNEPWELKKASFVIFSGCSHAVCSECFAGMRKTPSQTETPCPVCRAPVGKPRVLHVHMDPDAPPPKKPKRALPPCFDVLPR
jgi:hypothetical protein